MNVNLDLDDILDKEDVIELCEEYNIELQGDTPTIFEGIDFTKLSMHDMSKIELFLEKFEDIDLVTFEKFFHEH